MDSIEISIERDTHLKLTMQPTKSDIEEEIKHLAKVINQQVEAGRRLAHQASPYLKELTNESRKLIRQNIPLLRKQRLKLELMVLKGRRELVRALIERKKRKNGETEPAEP